MPLDLTEAIERTKLLADESGLLAQESYDLVLSKLDETDIHSFTIALVDLGIKTRTGSVNPKAAALVREALYGKPVLVDEPVEVDLAERLCRAAQALPVSEVEEEGGYEYEGVGVVEDPDATNIRQVLEEAGLSVSADGVVSFYQANIPGLYGEKLPQALPLDTAVRFWERKLEVADNERHRVQGLQDSLARLRAQVKERAETNRSPSIDEIDITLAELEEYGFDPRSRSKTTQGISQGLEGVFDVVMSKDWIGASQAIDNVQGTLEEYGAVQVDNYERDLYIWDALEKLFDLKESDPEAFGSIVKGLGGLAARLLKAMGRTSQGAYDRYYGEDPAIEEGPAVLDIFLSKQDVYKLIHLYTQDIPDEVEGILRDRDQVIDDLAGFVAERLEEDKEVEEFIVQEWEGEGDYGEVNINVVEEETSMYLDYKGKSGELDSYSQEKVMDILHMIVDGLVEDFLYA